MKVTNINKINGHSHELANWLEHWEKFSGENIPECCQEKSCSNKPEVGVLVQKNSSTDRGSYVLPLCGVHGDRNGEKLRVMNSVNLVSVHAGNAVLHFQYGHILVPAAEFLF